MPDSASSMAIHPHGYGLKNTIQKLSSVHIAFSAPSPIKRWIMILVLYPNRRFETHQSTNAENLSTACRISAWTARVSMLQTAKGFRKIVTVTGSELSPRPREPREGEQFFDRPARLSWSQLITYTASSLDAEAKTVYLVSHQALSWMSFDRKIGLIQCIATFNGDMVWGY